MRACVRACHAVRKKGDSQSADPQIDPSLEPCCMLSLDLSAILSSRWCMGTVTTQLVKRSSPKAVVSSDFISTVFVTAGGRGVMPCVVETARWPFDSGHQGIGGLPRVDAYI